MFNNNNIKIEVLGIFPPNLRKYKKSKYKERERTRKEKELTLKRLDRSGPNLL